MESNAYHNAPENNLSDSDDDITFDSASDTDEEFGETISMLKLVESSTTTSRVICRTGIYSGKQWIDEMLDGHHQRIFDMFRMDKECFRSLCKELKERELLDDDRHVSVEEALGIFLYTLGHNCRNRNVAERFQRSGSTISLHFSLVLRAICKLANVLIKPHYDQNVVPPEILYNPKYMPWFKDCVGAIDGTFVSASAPASKSVQYRGRKATISQNVMAICSFDMLFTFVYAGWEGTANDSRVLLDAISRTSAKFPWPSSENKYYVVDSGYSNMPGFLAPYRGHRYHLRDYRGADKRPRGPMELFNYRHSSLRNVIERSFGVLKERFPILKMMPSYPLRRQRRILVACCAIHNWIRLHTRNDELFERFMQEDMIVNNEVNEGEESRSYDVEISQSQITRMSGFRDELAGDMWRQFSNRT